MPFGEKETQLLRYCLLEPPDRDAVRRMLTSEEADINACDGDETLLSAVIAGFAHRKDGTRQDNEAALADMIRLFLTHGFDVRGQNGRAGAVCLVQLMLNHHDDAMLRMADMLLTAGTDPYYLFAEDGETLLETVRFEAFFLEENGLLREAALIRRLYDRLLIAAKERPSLLEHF